MKTLLIIIFFLFFLNSVVNYFVLNKIRTILIEHGIKDSYFMTRPINDLILLINLNKLNDYKFNKIILLSKIIYTIEFSILLFFIILSII